MDLGKSLADLGRAAALAVLGALGSGAWADDFSAWKDSADFRINTKANGADIAGDVRDFPLLIRLDSAFFPFGQAAADGRDIRFSTTDGMSLAFETERWDAGLGKAEIWVRIPLVKARSDSAKVRMHWGNPGAAAVSDGKAVFAPGAGFAGVWHLQGTSLGDASGNAGAGEGSRSGRTDGLIADARALTGPNQGMLMPDAKGLDMDSDITVSAWIRADAWSGGNHSILQKGDSILQYGLTKDSVSDSLVWSPGSRSLSRALKAPLPSAGSWHLVAATYDGAFSRLYVDGALAGSLASSGPVIDTVFKPVFDTVVHTVLDTLVDSLGNAVVDSLGNTIIDTTRNTVIDSLVDTLFVPRAIPRNLAKSADPVCLGCKSAAGKPRNAFKGTLDEAIVSSTVRSADFIKLSYATQRPGQTAVIPPAIVYCRSEFRAPADTALPEGGQFVLKGIAACATGSLWTVVSGPAPRILDPEAKTLTATLPRITKDTVVIFRFTAQFPEQTMQQDVKVTIKESRPDPVFTLPVFSVWNGKDSLTVRPTVSNMAALRASRDTVIRYAWTVTGGAADTAWRPGALVIKRGPPGGTLTVGLCADNGGAVACKTTVVKVAALVGLSGQAAFSTLAPAAPAPVRDANGRRSGGPGRRHIARFVGWKTGS